MAMLSNMQKQEIGNFLEKLATSIDLTEAQYKDAIAKYEAIGKFLANPDCSLAPYKPEVGSQGSMRIGTVTRPIHEDGEFDVDSTCRLSIPMPSLQYQIKKLVGDCFKGDGTYAKMLEEKKRCWRLKYADASRFHFDVVPVIPDDFQWLLDLNVPYRYAKYAVRITDITHKDFYKVSSELPRSNPEGYALWFLDVMKIQADSIRIKLSAELKMSVEQIPDYRVRTPLQRAVQLMKRHRDMMYENSELKPISIIITTLAARAYSDVMVRNSGGLFYDIVLDIVERMPSYIEKKSGISWITNPVNPNENFADKWQSNKSLEDHFFKWHKAFLDTLRHEKLSKSPTDKADYLRLSFGARAVNEVLNANEQQRLAVLRTTAAIAGSGTAYTDRSGNITSNPTGVKNQEHRFHYKDSIKIPRKRDYRYGYLQFQKKLIEDHYDFLKCKIEKNVLKCTGWLQPAGCKEAYKILIEYVVGHEPKTSILQPDITPSYKIHMYGDHSLCLHFPLDMKWTENTKVYQFTIPWVSEWLVYYELYQVNGCRWEGKESPVHLTEATINVNKDEDVSI